VRVTQQRFVARDRELAALAVGDVLDHADDLTQRPPLVHHLLGGDADVADLAVAAAQAVLEYPAGLARRHESAPLLENARAILRMRLVDQGAGGGAVELARRHPQDLFRVAGEGEATVAGRRGAERVVCPVAQLGEAMGAPQLDLALAQHGVGGHLLGDVLRHPDQLHHAVADVDPLLGEVADVTIAAVGLFQPEGDGKALLLALVELAIGLGHRRLVFGVDEALDELHQRNVDLLQAVAEHLLMIGRVGEGAVRPLARRRLRPRGPVAHARDRLRAVHDRVGARDRVLLVAFLCHIGADAQDPVAPAAGIWQQRGGPADEAPLAGASQQMAFVRLGRGCAARPLARGRHLVVLLARNQMHERIQRQHLALAVAELLGLGVAADEAPGHVLHEHDHVGGIEHARDEIALLAQPRLAQEDAPPQHDGDQRKPEARGSDDGGDQDQSRARIGVHHRLRQRDRDHQREVLQRPQIRDAGCAVGGGPFVAVALAGEVGRIGGQEEVSGGGARAPGIVDHQDAVDPHQRDVVIRRRPYQAKALGEHGRVDHHRDRAGQLALAGDDRAADREGPGAGAGQLEWCADGQTRTRMMEVVVVERPWIEAGGGKGGAVARHHAQRAFIVADDDALHHRQSGQARLDPLLQARAAIGVQLVRPAKPCAGELQDRIDLMQLPGGLLGHGKGEAAQVVPALVVFGFVELPARDAGADRGQGEHKADQRRKRAARPPLFGVMRVDGLVAFRHPISVTMVLSGQPSCCPTPSQVDIVRGDCG
jgi:hypothetical protein